jgi:hypothetical protein
MSDYGMAASGAKRPFRSAELSCPRPVPGIHVLGSRSGHLFIGLVYGRKLEVFLERDNLHCRLLYH